jgi:hypothetical protein
MQLTDSPDVFSSPFSRKMMVFSTAVRAAEDYLVFKSTGVWPSLHGQG